MKISELTKEQVVVYNLFIKQLKQFDHDGLVKKLCRGYDLEFAYKQFCLDVKYNSDDQFAERLFYYGNKAKSLWKFQCNRPYGINEVSDKVFSLIFKEFYQILQKASVNTQTDKYIAKNSHQFAFFCNKNNEEIFLKTVKPYIDSEKLIIRNYYFSILHQLNESNFNHSSVLISSTTNENEANKFSGGSKGIKIFFWQPNLKKKRPIFKDLPIFNGNPYENQKEIPVFGVIFPHYIYKFTHNGETHLNPAIFKLTDFEIAMFTGLPVDNEDIDTKKNDETIYKSTVTENPDGSLSSN